MKSRFEKRNVYQLGKKETFPSRLADLRIISSFHFTDLFFFTTFDASAKMFLSVPSRMESNSDKIEITIWLIYYTRERARG